jgi:signal transduction histidine kinase
MISDMMLFAKPPELVPGEVNVAELADEVVAELKPWASEQGTRLQHRASGNVPNVIADRVQLAVAIRSLCTNSLEALGADGAVEVRTSSVATGEGVAGSTVVIAVRDTGPGITAATRRHLFDPFFSGREAGRGIGLGLSKCWRIVTLHGGRIDVASEPGQGTTFTIRLPQKNR